MAVLKEHRHCAIGSAMLKELITVAKAQNLEKVYKTGIYKLLRRIYGCWNPA